ncbi:hypothetical protein MVES1_001358 [Malassezia vespertilionis]|uniref:L domain-like protein n=1 Tax=Malassezia vespertilionis TaxID=2020962 RepID=A0A2N1JE86_9BASI|nr:uncharacterized protein MVES1_001358 [Malassezia vespertilionis]PKI84858.1 hypothetical protein MVES_001274 [Malassezia vespertilionis]WFD06020.1 hypothetical protein MVES1_001358 [Malassezia vespertilionis]
MDDAPILERAALSLAGHALPSTRALAKTLAQFAVLHKLDVANMQSSPDAPQGLQNLQWLVRACALSNKHAKTSGDRPLAARLTWLNLAHNTAFGTDVDATEGLDLLTALHVLNISHCALRTWPAGIAAMASLKALVLSHNALQALPPVFPHLAELNTLVLSNNQLRALPPSLPASLPALKKVSISHNALEDGSALPDFSVCRHLREVRMAGNSKLGSVPRHILRWGRGIDGRGPGLALLDVGDCGLATWQSIAPLLVPDADVKGLTNLCLQGNRVALQEGYKEKMRAAHPRLHILDNARLEMKQEHRSAPPKDTGTPPKDTGTPPKDTGMPPAATSAQKRALDVQRDDPKKVRKRSGRGAKKPRSEEETHARATPRMDADANTRAKKTRRKKKGAHAVELDMQTDVPQAPQRAARAPPSPSAETGHATGIVDVIDIRRAEQKAPLDFLAKRDTELGGW